MRLLIALILIATPALAQRPVLTLPDEFLFFSSPVGGGAGVYLGDEPGAVTSPGFFEVEAVFSDPTSTDRVFVDAGGVKVYSLAGRLFAEILTDVASFSLERNFAAADLDISFSWGDGLATLDFNGQSSSIALIGNPTPNLGDLTVGTGGGDAVALSGWRIAARNIFGDGFESGDLSAWISCPGQPGCVSDPGPVLPPVD